MATIQKTLKGIVRITTSDTYEFNLPINTGTALPNALDNSALEEVYIIIENPEEEITPLIVLPLISTFNNAWNTKIYVINKGDVSTVATPRVPDEGQPDSINFLGTTSITGKTTGYFHIVDYNLWACWITP